MLVIGFPKGQGRSLSIMRETGVNAAGWDETLDPEWADASVAGGIAGAGNLDPLALIAGGKALDDAIQT